MIERLVDRAIELEGQRRFVIEAFRGIGVIASDAFETVKKLAAELSPSRALFQDR